MIFYQNYRRQSKEPWDAKISWDVIHACSSANEIADLMRQHGIVGVPGDCDDCVLAVATDSEVMPCYALSSNVEMHILNDAEVLFVRLYDCHAYPDLIDPDAQDTSEDMDLTGLDRTLPMESKIC